MTIAVDLGRKATKTNKTNKTTGGSFHETQNCLAGKALKAIFEMNKYLYQFTDISIKHRLDLLIN